MDLWTSGHERLFVIGEDEGLVYQEADECEESFPSSLAGNDIDVLQDSFSRCTGTSEGGDLRREQVQRGWSSEDDDPTWTIGALCHELDAPRRPPGDGCIYNSDCQSEEVCFEAECQIGECVIDSGCDYGEECRDLNCVDRD